jgi:RNA polymerase sigma-70 factor (ECF subfamily)
VNLERDADVDAGDLELIGRCAAGDRRAFDALYAAHAGRVRAYLRRQGFAAADVDDLGQETFVRVFKSLATFDAARGTFRQWLGAVARNVARRHWQRRAAPQSFDPELADELFAADEPPGTSAAEREHLAAVTACVGELPRAAAALVRLRYVEGRTTRAIAEAVGLPEATVRLRLKEALAALAAHLRARGVEL